MLVFIVYLNEKDVHFVNLTSDFSSYSGRPRKLYQSTDQRVWIMFWWGKSFRPQWWVQYVGLAPTQIQWWYKKKDSWTIITRFAFCHHQSILGLLFGGYPHKWPDKLCQRGNVNYGQPIIVQNVTQSTYLQLKSCNIATSVMRLVVYKFYLFLGSLQFFHHEASWHEN